MRVDALNSRETLVQTDVLLHELSVGEALRDAAAAEPDRLAVVDPASGRRLTYAELSAQPQRVTHGLRVGMAREIEQRTARASALSGSDHSARGCHSEAEIAAAIRRAIRSHAAGGCAGAAAAAIAEIEAEIPYPLSQVITDIEQALQRKSFHDRTAEKRASDPAWKKGSDHDR